MKIANPLTPPSSPPTASDLLASLRSRHDPQRWALFANVGDATGFGGSRRADAIAMSLWPSEGLEVHGYELKVSRSDWLVELKDPDKWKAVGSYCDRWWLVAADDSIARRDELPPGWGMLVAEGDSLVVRVRGKKLDAKPVDKSFFASLARAAQKAQPSFAESDVETARAAERLKAAGERDRLRAKHYDETRNHSNVLWKEREALREAKAEIDRLRASLALLTPPKSFLPSDDERTQVERRLVLLRRSEP